MNARYAIVCTYFGLFDDERTIAVTDNIVDAKFIVEALEKAFEDRPFTFSCKKLVADINPLLDSEETLFDYLELDFEKGGQNK